MARYFLLKTIPSQGSVVEESLNIILSDYKENKEVLKSIPGIKTVHGCGSAYKHETRTHKIGFEITFQGEDFNDYINLEEILLEKEFEVWLTEEDEIIKTERLKVIQDLKNLRTTKQE